MKMMRYAAALLLMVSLAGCDGCNRSEGTGEAVSSVQEESERRDTVFTQEEKTDTAAMQDDGTEVVKCQRDTEECVERFIFSKKEKIYSPEQLVGEWVNGTLHELYYSDSTGLQWDTKDDVSKEEAQIFYWEMKDNNLRQLFRMSLGGVVPRDYKVTMVDDESLVYKDDFGIVFMWDKKK